MTRQKRNLHGSAAVVLALAIGCGCWGLAGGCGAFCDPANVCGFACCDDLDSGCIPELSLCCGFDQDPCGNTCCPAGESCVAGATCCPDARMCGDVCCPEGSVCDTGTDQCVCKPENVCGDACCDDLDSGCIPELSLCCGFDQEVCGVTCCAVGTSCVDGTTCCLDARICGDVCCPEGHGCDTQTNQCTPCPNATDIPCDVGGCCPEGTFCQDVEGYCCPPGWMCCDQVNCSTGCLPISWCIG